MKNVITMGERERIYDNMVDLLTEYDYSYTADALYKIIDTWAEQKADLIQLFKKHPNYVEGEFLIAFNQDWNRQINPRGAAIFSNWIRDNAEAIRENFPEYVKEIREKDRVEKEYDMVWGSFDSKFPLTLSTDFLPWNPSFYAYQFVREEHLKMFNKIDPSMHFSKGMKMSRAINKICHWLGIDKMPDYNKEFAKYADSVNPLKIVRHTILSINPLDYLTMSFGNSWASCHTIDKKNRRNMPNSYEGQYSSGTISYMLDQVSMVFYTVDASYEGNEYYFEDKINRCMFHYGKDKLIQGRVYPQSNDNNADGIYKDIREIVQRVMSECLEIPNYWTTRRGPDEIGDYVCDDGTNYADYRYYNNCCICFPKEKEINDDAITIGHDPICIDCGEEHTNSENINHCTAYRHSCENCGCIFDEDDGFEVNGDWYCSDCAHSCEHCYYVYTTDELTNIRDNIWVCEDCRDDFYTLCDECEEWHRDYDTTYIERYGISVCDNCLENNFIECGECGDYFRKDDLKYDEDDGVWYCDDCWEEIHDNEKEEEE